MNLLRDTEANRAFFRWLALGHRRGGIVLRMAFYVVQIALASWWLRHFSMGPVEWLWRSLTYFKLQPLARPAMATA